MATDQSLQTLAAQVQGLMLRCRLIWLLDTETVISSLTPSLRAQQQSDCYMDAALCATDKGTYFSLHDLCFMTIWKIPQFIKLPDIGWTENVFIFLYLIQGLLIGLN